MIDFSFLIYDAPLWFIFWVWTKVLLSDSSGNVKKKFICLSAIIGLQPNVHLLYLCIFWTPKFQFWEGCKNKHQNFASWHDMGQIMDSFESFKLKQIKINDKNWVQLFQFFRFQFWLFFAAKIQMRLFVVFQPFFCLKFHVGIFVPYFDLKNRLKNKYS